MFVSQIIFVLIFVSLTNALPKAKILDKVSQNEVKVEHKIIAKYGEYFPGIHQSINSSDDVFSYRESEENGPSTWGSIWPECDGVAQSPINIEESTTKPGKAPTLFMDYFNKEVVAVNLTNTGHTINFHLTFADNKPNRLHWNGNGKIYIFDSIHLHFGLICGGGSEHTINGHRYAAEFHIVHFNQKYKTFSSAVLENDGIAVITVFLELAEESTNDGSNDNKFVKFLNNVTNEGESFLVVDKSGVFTIQELIKNEIKDYYSYKGSLTTPPCYETVRWIVAKKPVKIYPSELVLLSNLKGRFGQISRNFRPLQERNDRKIYDYDY